MEAFRSRRGGGVSGQFSTDEALLLRSLVDQVVALLVAQQQSAPPAGDRGAAPTAADVPGPDDAGADDRARSDEAVLRDLEAMFADGADGRFGAPADPPEDPALARLLPDAYTGDPSAAGEFRRYTEYGLRSAKRDAARVLLATLPPAGGPVRLSADEAQAWLRALNDVRLTLGVRLDVSEEFEQQWARLDPGDARRGAFEAYAWLGAVQESLVAALS